TPVPERRSGVAVAACDVAPEAHGRMAGTAACAHAVYWRVKPVQCLTGSGAPTLAGACVRSLEGAVLPLPCTVRISVQPHVRLSARRHIARGPSRRGLLSSGVTLDQVTLRLLRRFATLGKRRVRVVDGHVGRNYLITLVHHVLLCGLCAVL